MRKPSLKDLHHDLDETQGIINILERASRELSTIIDWDEGLRKNPLRHRQLASIGEQIAIARGKQTSVARMIERLESRREGDRRTISVAATDRDRPRRTAGLRREQTFIGGPTLASDRAVETTASTSPHGRLQCTDASLEEARGACAAASHRTPTIPSPWRVSRAQACRVVNFRGD
jgi:hypothetical protein